MKFISNRILNPASSGGGPTLNEWYENFINKQASEAKPECNDDPRGQCRGQVINNDNEPNSHSYQEGESVDGKKDQAEGGSKKKAHCTKDMGECSKAGDVTEEHSDAESADVGKAQVSQKINNDPNYQKGESTNPGKVDGKNKKESPKKSSDKKKTSNSKNITKTASKGFKKIASLNRKEKLELFAAMTSKQNKLGTPAWPLAYVEAMVGVKFSNLKDDEKKWFKNFWSILYPDSYVEEMVQDR